MDSSNKKKLMLKNWNDNNLLLIIKSQFFFKNTQFKSYGIWNQNLKITIFILKKHQSMFQNLIISKWGVMYDAVTRFRYTLKILHPSIFLWWLIK
jgi:hypothetical protein